MEKGICVVCAVYNEEKRIKRFIKSFYEFDQIIIVDKSSSDRTAEIAKSMGVDVIVIPYTNNSLIVHDYALKLIRYDWVLCATASDSIHPKLTRSFYSKVMNDSFNLKYNNIAFPCVSYVLGISGKHTFFSPTYRNMLGRVDSIYLQDSVHNELHYKNSRTYRYKLNDDVALYHMAHESVEDLFDRWLIYSYKELDKNYSYKEIYKQIVGTIHTGIHNRVWRSGRIGISSMLFFMVYRIMILMRYIVRDIGDVSSLYDSIAEELSHKCKRVYRNEIFKKHDMIS